MSDKLTRGDFDFRPNRLYWSIEATFAGTEQLGRYQIRVQRVEKRGFVESVIRGGIRVFPNFVDTQNYAQL